MFKQRLISGIILVIIAFVTLYYGGFLTFGVVAAISLIGNYELLRVIRQEKSALAVASYTAAILYYALLLLEHIIVVLSYTRGIVYHGVGRFQSVSDCL